MTPSTPKPQFEQLVARSWDPHLQGPPCVERVAPPSQWLLFNGLVGPACCTSICWAAKAQPAGTPHLVIPVSASTIIGTFAAGGAVQFSQMEVAWKAELAKGAPVSMYSMVSVNITSHDQASAKLVVQCKTPLHFVPPAGTGIAALLAKGTATSGAKEKNARLLLIWGVRRGVFCPLGACIRATKQVPANTAVVL